MLVGHGREKGDSLVASIDSWNPSDGQMRLLERLMQLLALEVQVTGRGYHAQDHEGVPHKSIRRASIEEVREEGLCCGLEIEEVPDRRERTGMSRIFSKGPSSFQKCRA